MMVLDRFKTLVDAYGADPDRWPQDERAAAQDLLVQSAAARAYAAAAAPLDLILDRTPLNPLVGVDAATIAALIVRNSPSAGKPAVVGKPTLARGGQPRWWAAAPWSRRAFGWPNFAALAAAGVVGFLIGWSDLNAANGNRDLLDFMTPVTTLEEPLW